MDKQLKQRLIGASIIVALAVIVVPELIKQPVEQTPQLAQTEIPPRPAELSPPPETPTATETEATPTTTSTTTPTTTIIVTPEPVGETAVVDTTTLELDPLGPAASELSTPEPSAPEPAAPEPAAPDPAVLESGTAEPLAVTADSADEALIIDNMAEAVMPSAPEPSTPEPELVSEPEPGSPLLTEQGEPGLPPEPVPRLSAPAPEPAAPEPAAPEPAAPEPAAPEPAAPVAQEAPPEPAAPAEPPEPPRAAPQVANVDRPAGAPAEPADVQLPEIQLIAKSMSDPDPTPASATVEAAAKEPRWMVQAGSFSVADNANQLRDQLRRKNFAASLSQVQVNGQTLYRVQVGPHATRSEGERTQTRLQQEAGIKGSIVPVYN